MGCVLCGGVFAGTHAILQAVRAFHSAHATMATAAGRNKSMGATRNLTTHFMRLRSRFEADRKRRSSSFGATDGLPLMSAAGGAGAGAGAGAGGWDARRSVPPVYVDVVTRCHTHMEQIEDKSSFPAVAGWLLLGWVSRH